MLKKLFAAIVAAAMVLGLSSFAIAAPVFPDTAGIPEEPHIARLKTLGIVTGDADGKFNPDGTFTRIQAATIAVRLLGLESAASFLQHPTIFPDVEARHQWAWGYINIAAAQGIVKGTPEGKFEPDRPITELEAVVLFLNVLGYKGVMPGGWPAGYIMKAADLGLLRPGFNPAAPATRAFVAEVADLVLDQKMVRENKDYPGEYDYLQGEPSLYTKVFGGTTVLTPDEVTAVNTTARTITLKNGGPKSYASSVVIYGKDKVADILGHYIVYATNRDGLITFIQVTTPSEVVGVIEGVDGVNKTLTIGGVTYKVDDAAYVEKNGQELTGTIAVKLAGVQGTDAKVYLRDGKVYRIVATYLEKSPGTITGKRAAVTPDGLTYYISIGGTELPLASDAVLLRNGQPATWGDFKSGDQGDYATRDGKIVYLDVWMMTIDGLKVVAKFTDPSTGKFKATLVDAKGVTKTYEVADATVFYDADFAVGQYVKITLDRKNVITDVVPGSAWSLGGTIASTSITTEGTKIYYYVVLQDGTTYKWDESTAPQGKVSKNGLAVTGVWGTDVWPKFKVGDYMGLAYNPDGTLKSVALFSPGVVEGVASVVEAAPGSDVTKTKVTMGTVAEFTVADGFEIKLNGQASTADQILAGDVVRVTWNAAKGTVAALEVGRFTDPTKHAVASWVENEDGTITFTLANGVTLATGDNTIVVRNGAAASVRDVTIGDTVLYYGTNPTSYIEAYSDTKAPVLVTDAPNAPTAVWAATYKVTVTLTFNEELYSVKALVDGKEVAFGHAAGNAFVFTGTTAADYQTKPASVSVSFEAKDYAGNKLVKTITIPVQ